MNYSKELESLIDNEKIWGKKFEEISDCDIEKVKRLLKCNRKIKLNRMLMICEDIKIEVAEVLNIFIGITGIALAVAAIILSIDKKPGIVVSVVYLLFIVAMAIFFGAWKSPRNRRFNNKIKCINIALKELLEK